MIAFLLAALLQVPPRDARPGAATAAGRITGIVTSDEAQARPLRRTRVTLSGAALDMPRTAITGDTGTFAFDGLPPGRFTVAAAKEGYVGMSFGATRPGRPGRGVPVAAGQSLSLTLRLPRGAVITGTVTDIDGQPAQGIRVEVLTQRYVGGVGERRYVSAGRGVITVTDDRGVYRIFGLPAGDYVVSAQPLTRQAGVPFAELRTLQRGQVSDRSVIMATVFYPGAGDVTRAQRVTVRAGEERAGIDIALQYEPLATVSGTVQAAADGLLPSVWLTVPDDPTGRDPARAVRPDPEGRFTFAGVPPGRFSVIALPNNRPGAPPAAIWSSAEIIVNGEDIANVSLSLERGLTIAGRVVFEGERAPASLIGLPINVPATTSSANLGRALPPLRLEADGTFRIDGVMPGVYRAFGPLQGIRQPIGAWWMTSLTIGGREVLDAPLDLRQSAGDAVATFTDKASEISGTLTDASGAPAPDGVVVAFSTDRRTWFFNSRRVAAARPTRDGRYTIRNLPPGDYRIAPADLDQGEWFDPAVLERLLPAATPVTIAGPEKTTLDLVIR
jgi:hypothetical protein